MSTRTINTLLVMLIIVILAFLIAGFFKAHAWYNPCKWQCQTASPSPTASPSATPSASPTEEPTPSPTEEPSATPVPTEQPCLIEDGEFPVPCPTDTPSPSASPSATPAPTDQPHQDVFIPQPGAPVGPACDKIQFAPTILTFSRNNPTSIHIGWSKVDDFVHDYVIQYGLASGIPLWSTIVTGNETDLNFLPFNHVLWVRAAGTENGCVGPFGEWIDP